MDTNLGISGIGIGIWLATILEARSILKILIRSRAVADPAKSVPISGTSRAYFPDEIRE